MAAITRGHLSTLGTVGSGTSVSTSFGTNPAAGSSILCYVQASGGAAPTSVVDNGTTPTTFTLDVSNAVNQGAFIYRANNITLPSSGSYSITVTVSGSHTIQAAAIEYGNMSTDPPLVTDTNTATSTAVATHSLNQSASGLLWFGGFSDGSGLNPETITFNSGASFTEQFRDTNGSSFWPMAVADALGLTGSNSLSWTLGDSVAWYTAFAVYAPAGSVVDKQDFYMQAIRRAARY